MQFLPYLSAPAIVRPAAERTVTRRVTIDGKRQTIHLCAYGWETRNSWGHSAYCPELNVFTKIRYYNRTWEAQRFDSVLADLLDKCRMQDAGYRKAKAREAREIRAWNDARMADGMTAEDRMSPAWTFKAWQKRERAKAKRAKAKRAKASKAKARKG